MNINWPRIIAVGIIILAIYIIKTFPQLLLIPLAIIVMNELKNIRFTSSNNGR